jgi:hypothetical protein
MDGAVMVADEGEGVAGVVADFNQLISIIQLNQVF